MVKPLEWLEILNFTILKVMIRLQNETMILTFFLKAKGETEYKSSSIL